MFWCNHWLRFHIFCRKNCPEFPRIVSIQGAVVFDRLQRVTTHKKVEVVCFVIFCGLIVDFKTDLEQIIKCFKFSDFPSKDRDLGCCEILWIMLLKLAEMLLLANCWGANKKWSASIVAMVLYLPISPWVVQRVSLCFPEETPVEEQGVSSWTLVTMRGSSSGSESSDWSDSQTEDPTSGWVSFWELSYSVARFLRLCSGMSTERFKSASVPVRSCENRFV